MSHVTMPGTAGGGETARAGMTDSLVIPSRFGGPAGSGNGGYVCGRVAAYVNGPATVTLRRPVGRQGRKLAAGTAVLGPGGQVLASASAVWLTVPRPVPALAAEEAS